MKLLINIVLSMKMHKPYCEVELFLVVHTCRFLFILLCIIFFLFDVMNQVAETLSSVNSKCWNPVVVKANLKLGLILYDEISAKQ